MDTHKTALRDRLSPDLVPLWEKAERLMEEGLFQRARVLYLKLLEFVPADPYLQGRVDEADFRARDKFGPVSEGDGSDDDQTLARLIRDLDIGRVERRDDRLAQDYAAFLALPDEALRRIALDVAVALALGDDWEASLALVERLEKAGDPRAQVKVWKLRCLVEVERYAETIALSSLQRWPADLLIHVNYLLGLSYEALGVREQALLRFSAVQRQDPSYRKVAQKMLNY